MLISSFKPIKSLFNPLLCIEPTSFIDIEADSITVDPSKSSNSKNKMFISKELKKTKEKLRKSMEKKLMCSGSNR
jgi:hypothetical protein